MMNVSARERLASSCRGTTQVNTEMSRDVTSLSRSDPSDKTSGDSPDDWSSLRINGVLTDTNTHISTFFSGGGLLHEDIDQSATLNIYLGFHMLLRFEITATQRLLGRNRHQFRTFYPL